MKKKVQRWFRIKYTIPDDENGAIEQSTLDIREKDLPKYDWMQTAYDDVRVVEVEDNRTEAA